jgi:hypothetical protein
MLKDNIEKKINFKKELKTCPESASQIHDLSWE